VHTFGAKLTVEQTEYYNLKCSKIMAPTGHPQVRYTISYLKDYFNTTDPLHVYNLM
jgi:hypothetical protein